MKACTFLARVLVDNCVTIPDAVLLEYAINNYMYECVWYF